MKSSLLLGGLLVAVGGGVLLYRRAAEADPKYAASLRCKAARTIAGIYGAKISDEACATADSIDDKIGLNALVKFLTPAVPLGVQYQQRDAQNKALNGEIDIPLTSEIRGLTSQFSPDGSNPVALLLGSVLRFKNGGVPFAGHPDFAKCVPGTADMTTPGNASDRFWNIVPGKRPTSQQLYDAIGRGPASKPVPLTDAAAWAKLGVSWALTPAIGQLLRGSGYDPATSVPLGIVAGVKHECPEGQVLIEVIPVTDHRVEGSTASAIIKRCGAPGTGTTVAPPVASSGTSTSYTAPPSAPPPGFHWVQATATAPAHWERDR